MPRSIHSKAQWGQLEVLVGERKLTQAKFDEMAEGVDFHSLPEHVADAGKEEDPKVQRLRERVRRFRGERKG